MTPNVFIHMSRVVTNEQGLQEEQEGRITLAEFIQLLCKNMEPYLRNLIQDELNKKRIIVPGVIN